MQSAHCGHNVTSNMCEQMNSRVLPTAKHIRTDANANLLVCHSIISCNNCYWFLFRSSHSTSIDPNSILFYFEFRLNTLSHRRYWFNPKSNSFRFDFFRVCGEPTAIPSNLIANRRPPMTATSTTQRMKTKKRVDRGTHESYQKSKIARVTSTYDDVSLFSEKHAREFAVFESQRRRFTDGNQPKRRKLNENDLKIEYRFRDIIFSSHSFAFSEIFER